MHDTFRKLMDLLDRRERRNFWLLMGMVLVMGIANMAGVASVLPFLAVLAKPEIVQENAWLATLYDWSGASTALGFLLALGAVVVVAYLGAVAFKAGASYALARYGIMRTHTLAQRMLLGYLGQPYAWFLGRHSADLTKNVLGEVGQVVNGVLIPFLNLIANAVLVACLMVLLILVNPWVALFLGALMGGSYGLIYALVRRRVAALGVERVAANRERFKSVQEGLTGIKEVKVLGLERSILGRFALPSRRMAWVQAKNAIYGQMPQHLLEGIAFGGMMAVVLALAVLNDGDLAAILPVAGVYALAGSRISPAMQVVYRNLNQLRFGKAALDALHADLVDAPVQTTPPPPPTPLRLRAGLALEGVDYAYPGAERGALHGLSLEIRANATVGIVGGTGAGKTTAIDVIMGLLEPQGGVLRVDGRPIATEADRRSWRRSVGYVPQQIFLIDDTVSANIAFGLSEAEIDHAAVERAARMAQLHAFVTDELPKGYATRVGDRGVRLSGGQRQRIGIARALYHDPDVLVLDEATSALDNITERALMEAVRDLGGKKTIVMIAHRLSTVMGCDEIFLLERGQVAARGTYRALVETNPTFRAMAGDAAA